jgi:hypothetical protein
VKAPAFQARLDELFLQLPNTGVAEAAAAKHVAEVKTFVQTIVAAGESGADLAGAAPLRAPGFPEPGKGGTVRPDTIPTYAYNWCVSPLTPMAVSGVIWIPSEHNIGETPADYAAELQIHAKSLPSTYGMEQVQFLYAQPANSLVAGLTTAKIPGAKSVTFDQWPKSLKALATELAKLAE